MFFQPQFIWLLGARESRQELSWELGGLTPHERTLTILFSQEGTLTKESLKPTQNHECNTLHYIQYSLTYFNSRLFLAIQQQDYPVFWATSIATGASADRTREVNEHLQNLQITKLQKT